MQVRDLIQKAKLKKAITVSLALQDGSTAQFKFKIALSWAEAQGMAQRANEYAKVIAAGDPSKEDIAGMCRLVSEANIAHRVIAPGEDPGDVPWQGAWTEKDWQELAETANPLFASLVNSYVTEATVRSQVAEVEAFEAEKKDSEEAQSS